MKIIEDYLNIYYEDNKIDEDTKGDPTGEVIGEEDIVGNDRPRIDNAGTVLDRINMSFDGGSYEKSMQRQFLMKEDNQDTHDVTAYITVSTDIMCTQMSAKMGIKKLGNRSLQPCSNN